MGLSYYFRFLFQTNFTCIYLNIILKKKKKKAYVVGPEGIYYQLLKLESFSNQT